MGTRIRSKHESVNLSLFGGDPCKYLMKASFYVNFQKELKFIRIKVSKTFVFFFNKIWTIDKVDIDT